MSDDKPTDNDPSTRTDQPAADTSRRAFLTTTGLGAVSLVVACGDDDGLPDGGGSPDGGGDGGGGDGGGRDGGRPADGGIDMRAPDGGREDAGLGPLDAGPDAPLPDGGPGDAGTDASADAGMSDGPDPITANESAFAMAVSCGDPSPETAILWTHYSGDATLRIGVWPWDGTGYGAQVVDEAATPSADGFVHASVTGLLAGARYRYAFLEMDGGTPTGRSQIGNFRTAIADSAVEVLRIGASSCTKDGSGAYGALASAGTRTDLDAFLLLGDTTYNDGATTLGQYRDKWRGNLSRDEYKALRTSVAIYATWDDHEVDNNYDAETIAPAQFAAAEQSFREHIPITVDADNPQRVWRSQRWGNTLEIFVLDCRSERRRSLGQYISREQMDWLKGALSDSPARFKLIMNSVAITDFPGNIATRDRWQGYPAQRNELLDHIDAGITGVFWVSGDFHFTSLSHVGANSGQRGWSQFEVLAGPGRQTINPAYGALNTGRTFLAALRAQFPLVSNQLNYVEMVFDPTAEEITIHWYNDSGDRFETQTARA